MIHLDTSVLIRVMDPGSPEYRKMRAWIRKGETFSMSEVAWAAYLRGPLTEPEIESAAEIVDRYEDFRLEYASVAARLFNESGRRRGSLANCMIAATALGARAPSRRATPLTLVAFENSASRLPELPPWSRGRAAGRPRCRNIVTEIGGLEATRERLGGLRAGLVVRRRQ